MKDADHSWFSVHLPECVSEMAAQSERNRKIEKYTRVEKMRTKDSEGLATEVIGPRVVKKIQQPLQLLYQSEQLVSKKQRNRFTWHRLTRPIITKANYE